jgi:citrate lyase beta subunit
MLETPEAIEQANAIAAVWGSTGSIGSNDLCSEMGSHYHDPGI